MTQMNQRSKTRKFDSPSSSLRVAAQSLSVKRAHTFYCQINPHVCFKHFPDVALLRHATFHLFVPLCSLPKLASSHFVASALRHHLSFIIRLLSQTLSSIFRTHRLVIATQATVQLPADRGEEGRRRKTRERKQQRRGGCVAGTVSCSMGDRKRKHKARVAK